jgi:hypothetical protein
MRAIGVVINNPGEHARDQTSRNGGSILNVHQAFGNQLVQDRLSFRCIQPGAMLDTGLRIRNCIESLGAQRTVYQPLGLFQQVLIRRSHHGRTPADLDCSGITSARRPLRLRQASPGDQRRQPPAPISAKFHESSFSNWGS